MRLKPFFFWIISILFCFITRGQGRYPKEESHLEGYNSAVNQLNLLFSRYPYFSGKGITISIKEQKFDTADIDFKGRIKFSPVASGFITTHASQMATLSAGAGNTSDNSKGAAWKAWISSSSFLNLMPDNDNYFESGSISIQNHSYGTGIESFYGEDAASYDSQALRRPELLHIFSAGNLGDQQNNSGTYAGLNFSNISGSFKMSKNSLAVGAIDALLNVAEKSSRGPAHDGRIKPELVAFGIDGSSGAAAITSGISAVLQQQYFDKNGSLPPSSLIRGILMNTAEDIFNPGPDFLSGYGNVQAMHAISIVAKEKFLLSGISPGELKNFQLDIPGKVPELKIMLTWTDPPSNPDTVKALIHDLDLTVEDPAGNLIYPWILNHHPNADSLKKPAYRGIDTLNNQEQVTVTDPLPGNYKMTIDASKLTSYQDFALTWYWEPDSLYWTYPVRGDKIERNKEFILRWNQPLKMTTNLEILDSGNWELLDKIPTGAKLFPVNATRPPGAYQLRINNGSEYLVTDSFTISDQLQMKVGFLCPDSTLLYWKQGTEKKYKIKYLPEKYLEDLAIVEDTIFVTKTSPEYYSVAELIDGLEGLRSLTINPALQGIGCFVSTFLADLVNNEGRLTLQLSTALGISTVKLQKLIGDKWITIDSSAVNSRVNFVWTDPELIGGTNYYRVEIDLGNRKVYSRVESIFFFNQKEVILYPNPLKGGSILKIAAKDTEGLLVEFFDGMGRKVFSYSPAETLEQIPAARLRSGIFFYRISRAGKKTGSGRLIVQ